MTKLTEKLAVAALLQRRWIKALCIPNYTPSGWFECDLFEVSKAGYFTEYEVKISLADFKHDAAKTKPSQWIGLDTPRTPGANKHIQLQSRAAGSPSRFNYVCPPDLAARINCENLLPEWAGLIEVDGRFCKTIVTAPKLHKTKLDAKIIAHARGVCYYRMHRLMLKYERNGNAETGEIANETSDY